MSEVRIIPACDGVELQALDAGFAYGFGLFETIRYEGGRLSFWAEHWQRLKASAQVFGIRCDVDEEVVLAGIAELIQLDGLSKSMIKLSLVRRQAAETLFVYARPLSEAPREVSLKVEERFPINPQSMLAGHKTHNYMEHFAILETAKSDGFYDAIRLDTAGFLAETTIGNLFFFRGDKLFTPSMEQGILPGVIRGQLLQLVDVSVGAYEPERLMGADAVLMTNSGSGILPVSRVSHAGVEQVFQSAAHPVVEKLRQRLLELNAASGTAVH
ncbi:MAG: aminotransferase class IV [Lentimonas sp.]